MQFRTAKCLSCNNRFEVTKESSLVNWSDLQFECPSCGSKEVKVILGEFETFDVAEGKTGNSKNSYSNGFINHSSKFGKFRGRKFKTKREV